MNTILGLDIGVGSVGFALIELIENDEPKIITTGVRIITQDPNFHGNFISGKTASKNEARQSSRSARRNLQRYKLRRSKLKDVLLKLNMYPNNELLKNTSKLELFTLRKKGLSQKLTLQEIGRIFLMLNAKRGFLSNRKSEAPEESKSEYLIKINQLKKEVQDKTIGEYFYNKILDNPDYQIKQNIFPRAEYINEFDTIWNKQKEFYPDILTGGLHKKNANTLYRKIKEEIIYFQRPLKSAKHLVGNCTFEAPRKTTPKSSPYFQLFRIYQQLNNIELTNLDNSKRNLTSEERIIIFNALHNPDELDKTGNLTSSNLFKLLKLNKNLFTINYPKIEGNKTLIILNKALVKAGVKKPEQYLQFNPFIEEEKNGLYQLWHITYSLQTDEEICNSLIKHFKFSADESKIIAESIKFTSDYGSLSSKAIKKLLPFLNEGLHYDKACLQVGYNHTPEVNKEVVDLLDFMPNIKPNELRNPVVEQILNQTANVVNAIIKKYGHPAEIRVELARELKNNAKKRAYIDKSNRELESENSKIKSILINDHNFKRVNSRDLKRYRLWVETDKKCLYSGNNIPFVDVYNGKAEIEHILPKSRAFSNAMSNLILAYMDENRVKNQMTAFDYMSTKNDTEIVRFKNETKRLFYDNKISKTKLDNLLCEGENIPDDFVARQLKDTQYISVEVVNRLKQICGSVKTTTGSVTDFLKDRWKLNDLLNEINFEDYKRVGLTEIIEVKDKVQVTHNKEVIKDFTKRSDQRHHAVDALIVALTTDSHIFRLNNLNKDYATYKDLKESSYNITEPIRNLRYRAKEFLESILVSYKKPSSKVMSRKVNRFKTKNGTKEQITWSPRGSLHEETILGQIKQYKVVKIKEAFNEPDKIVSDLLKKSVNSILDDNNSNPSLAIKSLKKKPIIINGIEIETAVMWNYLYTKKIGLNDSITPPQVEKIIDKKIQRLVRERIKNSGGNIKAAFKDYANNLIYIDKAKKLPVKRVRVEDNGSLIQLKRSEGFGYAYTKGNHHSIIYSDNDGNFAEKVVSFFEATQNCLSNLHTTGTIYPIIDKKDLTEDLKYKYSLQKNDLVLIGLNPFELDLNDFSNRKIIAKHLFRVQKMSKGQYVFRHQFQTTIDINVDFSMKSISSLKYFQDVYKIKLNHLGDIIKIGD